MTTRLVFGRTATFSVLLAACAASFIGCSKQSLIWTSGRLPTFITEEWYRANFADCIDICENPRQDSLWTRVRDRPDFLRILIAVVEDTSTPAFNRANAILRLGATNQEAAYGYIILRLNELPNDSEIDSDWLISLGSGYTTLPSFVYAALERQLQYPARTQPASIVLKDIGTLRSRQILEAAIPTVSRDDREFVTATLRDWKRRPERE
jgi:hypothetical protein